MLKTRLIYEHINSGARRLLRGLFPNPGAENATSLPALISAGKRAVCCVELLESVCPVEEAFVQRAAERLLRRRLFAARTSVESGPDLPRLTHVPAWRFCKAPNRQRQYL